jgi:hypothetical protein
LDLPVLLERRVRLDPRVLPEMQQVLRAQQDQPVQLELRALQERERVQRVRQVQQARWDPRERPVVQGLRDQLVQLEPLGQRVRQVLRVQQVALDLRVRLGPMVLQEQ